MAAGADAQEDELKGTLNSEDETEAQALAEALISALNLSEKPKKEDSDQDSTSEQPESGSDDSSDDVESWLLLVTTTGSSSLRQIVSQIKEGQIKNIITMAGAGISTSAGIPDFRSEGTGLYATINKKYPDLPSPEHLFDISYFRNNPEPFYEFAKELLPPAEGQGYQPTPCHKFIKKLHDKGLLLRHYTQNIDGLERRTGLPAEKLVEAHGSFAAGSHCIECQKKYSEEFVRDSVFKDTFPRCIDANCLKRERKSKNQKKGSRPIEGGLVKPDIVFFGESLPKRFFECADKDFKKCDLLIIMGTSLAVYPFAGLINMVKKSCPRLLINLERPPAFSPRSGFKNDVFLPGKCDDGCQDIENCLEWN